MAKEIIGTVIKHKMPAVAVVAVGRVVPHPKYLKTMRRRTTYFAQVQNELEIKVGDRVRIQEIRPVSRKTTFRVVAKL